MTEGEGIQNPQNGGDDMCGWPLSKFDFVGDIVLLYYLLYLFLYIVLPSLNYN